MSGPWWGLVTPPPTFVEAIRRLVNAARCDDDAYCFNLRQMRAMLDEVDARDLRITALEAFVPAPHVHTFLWSGTHNDWGPVIPPDATCSCGLTYAEAKAPPAERPGAPGG